MHLHTKRRVLVHCAANYRVTAFLDLSRVVRPGLFRDDAFGLMRTVWEPNEVSAQFIEAVLGEQDHAPEGARATPVDRFDAPPSLWRD
jgi:hypothetical protein